VYYCLANTTKKIFLHWKRPTSITPRTAAGGEVMRAMVRHLKNNAMHCLPKHVSKIARQMRVDVDVIRCVSA
jgi:hypothetical protein